MKKIVIVLLLLVIGCMMLFPAYSEGKDLPDKIFDEPKYEYTVTEKTGLFIPVDFKGMPLKYIQQKAANTKCFYYYLDAAGLHIFPIQKGKSIITLTNKLNKKDKAVFTVVIADSAVYHKGEDQPLTAYIVTDETAFENDEITGKYYIMGGSGKCDYISIVYDRMYDGAVFTDMSVEVRNKKNTGTFKIKTNVNGAAYRFHIYVEDTAGNKTEADSQILTAEYSDLRAMVTYDDNPLLDNGVRIKCYIKGGNPPYKCEVRCPDERKGMVKETHKNLADENEMVINYSDHKNGDVLLVITDKKRNETIVGLRPTHVGENEGLIIGCDNPFKTVGDKATVKAVVKPEQYKDIHFVLRYPDLESFQYVEQEISAVEEQPGVYTFDCTHSGVVLAEYTYVIAGGGGSSKGRIEVLVID